jgi:hypothetical protein
MHSKSSIIDQDRANEQIKLRDDYKVISEKAQFKMFSYSTSVNTESNKRICTDIEDMSLDLNVDQCNLYQLSLKIETMLK